MKCRHAGATSSLRCIRCDGAVCPKCMVEAPVGYQCRTCATARVRPQGELRKAQNRRRMSKVVGRITALVLIAGAAGGYLWLDRPQPGPVETDEMALALQPDRSGNAPQDTPEGYAVLSRDGSGRPLRFNPCEPLSYVVNPTGAPEGAMTAVNQAITEVSQASGIEFVPAGRTNERPSVDRQNSMRGARGEWSPILIAWDSLGVPTQTQGLGAVGGPGRPVRSNGRYVYVSGSVTMNTDVGMSVPQMKALLMHELGHVLGLDHVADPGQVMAPSGRADGKAEWGEGDLAGLGAVGQAAGCLTTPAAPGSRPSE